MGGGSELGEKNDESSFTLWSFLYNPHALQTGRPSPFRRHNVVVYVEQFEHVMPVFLTVVCFYIISNDKIS